VLWIIDDAQADEVSAGDADLGIDLPAAASLLRIRNKIDLSGREPGRLAAASTEPVEIACSATTGAGLDALRTELLRRVGLGDGAEAGGEFSARRRHLDALERTRKHLHAAQEAAAQQQSPELVAEDLRLAQDCLGEITGVVSSDDLLGRIFSEFCIGK
jgi:tRNA modification GTPase